MIHEFKLIFQLPQNSPPINELVEALAEAGCDDAIVGTGHPGRIALEFSRESENAREAIDSAFDDVQRALGGAELIEAAPDYAGLTEIADIIGISRQALRKQMLNQADFPRPFHCGNPSLWHLAPVLDWLQQQRGYRIDPALQEIAQHNMHLNTRQQRQKAEMLTSAQTTTA
ncbi:DNA-binding protein [Wenzhouxiangella sp. AB-CW3]|uniref:helix-turn-helix transcriptional regulator n=1 Tax=Wenzhouxiangella sp. AB-CW3 TaxID=2771012 RepID=UPI00168AD0A4|nr:DNA-binding protein [Wenzhouxiangella sp. AB-CW3]QOC23766.1 DNA-binding protein [Wenzhouxiangella sp. AB-CW3]